MPQEKFITRKRAGIGEVLDSETGAYTDTRKGEKIFDKSYKGEMNKAYDALEKAYRVPPAKRGPLDISNAEKNLFKAKTVEGPARRMLTANQSTVARRDATNARIARERLSTRASSAKSQPRGGGVMAKAAALGPVAEGAAALYAADEATGFKRTKYSGNFGGPSFSMNPYASSNKPAYSGQSNVSKLMGVGKK